MIIYRVSYIYLLSFLVQKEKAKTTTIIVIKKKIIIGKEKRMSLKRVFVGITPNKPPAKVISNFCRHSHFPFPSSKGSLSLPLLQIRNTTSSRILPLWVVLDLDKLVMRFHISLTTIYLFMIVIIFN